MRLVTTAHMRRLEQVAVDAGATWSGLMEQAGWGVAQEALRYLGDARGRRVVVLAGPGNNGGDGLVVARHLHDAQAMVSLYFWNRANPEQDANWQRCRQRDMPEMLAADDAGYEVLRRWLVDADLVIDALLGMGVSRPVTGSLAEVVMLVNHTSAERRTLRTSDQHQRALAVLAVDVPTGIDSDRGLVMGTAIDVDMTVATGLPKRGLVFYPGRAHAGSISVADLDIPSIYLEAIMSKMITTAQARSLLPARPEDSHKGTFGKVMVVAGSLFYPGAAILATAGAARVGAGLVTLASARSVLSAGGRLPEITLLPLAEADWGAIGPEASAELGKRLESYDALLIGPGLGQEEATVQFLQRLLGLDQPKTRGYVGFISPAEKTKPDETEQRVFELPPAVLDADGLNMLAKVEGWSERLPRERFVFTPHPGEMTRLLGVDELDADRIKVAVDAAAQWGQVVVLKGATTVVSAPDGRSVTHALGNPALATAGTGDVLAGAIAGFLAQGSTLFDAAVLGVYLHAAAGQLALQELGDAGALASDLLPRLPLALKQLKADS